MNNVSLLVSNKLRYHPDRVAEFMQVGGSRPISAQFRITDRCPFSCSYCDKPVQQSDSHVDDKFIARLKELGVKSIVITGGEPTVYDKFDEDIQKLAQHFKLGLVTTLIKYRPALETCFEWIKVSLDSVDSETYAEIRGLDAVESVLNNMRKLHSNAKKDTVIGAQIVLTHDNCSLSQMRAVARATRKSAHYLQVRPVESPCSEPYLYSSEEQLRDVSQLASEYAGFVVVSPKFNYVGAEPPRSCPARWTQLVISSGHDVLLCCNRQQESVCSLYDERVVEILREQVDVSRCYSPCALSEHNEYLKSLSIGTHREFV